jgi:hypothetical protein
MTRDEVIKSAREAGLVVEPCPDEKYIAVRVGEAENSNERMRLTEDMQILIVSDGYYWQVVTVEDIAAIANARNA